MDDLLIFGPGDVDLSRSPLRPSLPADEPTFVLGAFNPGLTRLPDGDLLLMVRVAEALAEPARDGAARTIRWTPDGYVLDAFPLAAVDMSDPRQFELKRPGGLGARQLGLTSLSWLLPVRLAPDGRSVKAVMYERAIAPAASYQAYGVEDARVSRVDGRWWMTTCAVSAERLGTALYSSADALDWRREGLVLDHLNKDMLLFEGRIGGAYWALTRPLGEVWFAYGPDQAWTGGPCIQFASSPDALHWKPADAPGLRPRKGSISTAKMGGGTPPVLTPEGWLTLWHGVEARERVGVYRTFWSLLDRDQPTRVLRHEDTTPVLEAEPVLTDPLGHLMYLPTPVVFTTGLVDGGDHWIAASGEADLACRMSFIPKARFA